MTDGADLELADLLAAASCIDLRPGAARRACEVLERTPHETRFPRQRQHPASTTVVVPDAAVAHLDGWD